jgi:hypothetical protein
LRKKQKESSVHELVFFILRILHALVRTLEQVSIKKHRRVEKINVERD